MASVLTEHVRHFGTTSDPSESVLPELERLLRHRMRQRNLLSSSPRFLGYPGVSSWNTPNAFEDIVADCYIFAILERRKALQKQLKIKPNVDGLISRNVGSFLLERQRRSDPLGYAVYGCVKGAALEAVEHKEIAVEKLEQSKIYNESILRLPGSRPGGVPAAPNLIQNAVQTAIGWTEVIQYLTETTAEGREWVRGFFHHLQQAGITAVRFGDLVAALANRVRDEWVARHASTPADSAMEGDEFAVTVRMVWPDESIEARERWTMLKRLIPERIAGLNRQERVRERLATVFAALVKIVEEGHATPTQADLIERTGIPRATLSDDFRILKEIFSELEAGNPE